MDKAAIKLHKMNIFPKVPPLYTHLPSTFLPVFSGTMLPNGLSVSCLPPPDSIPLFVGATTRRPHAYLIFIYVIKRSAVSYVCLLLAAFPVSRGDHRSPARPEFHSHMSMTTKNGRPMVARTSLFLRYLYISFDAKMSLIAAMSRRYHRTVIHSARDRLPFHHRKRVSQGNATTNKRHPRTKREVRGAPNPISKKLSHPQGMREFSGAANGIRTHDLVITNDVLYRLSYSSVSNA